MQLAFLQISIEGNAYLNSIQEPAGMSSPYRYRPATPFVLLKLLGEKASSIFSPSIGQEVKPIMD